MYFGQLWCFLSLLHVVWGNTESLRLSLHSSIYSPLSSSALTVTPESSRVAITIEPQFTPQDKQIQLSGFASGSYELRVCWPASSPLVFRLRFDATSQQLLLTYTADYYSHIQSLQKTPLPATIDIIVDEVWFGLPRDLLAVVAMAVGGGIGSYFASSWIYEYINQ
ncbi:hypothetical protein NADFUDRAFT_83922 [Nadsonia fulvescens var. elongata DSM 6958]|uniref:Uncharacterized protein n=1 Tax=Nadsonia fulvescens var. elongata DSM 6958 TaxID=857566 RepID=A0A1E3PFS6_9ASCO|nr:hypothetical protein NADFUDRAFT_83922 [Nadsonia fulvescens var. elongata DSM 6958]